MTNYPINSTLRAAIESLFDDPSVGLGLLGPDDDFLPSSAREPALRLDMPPADRASRLRGKLEAYVSQMAAELDELGEKEAPRLRAEATATLVVLRELQIHFPEAFDG